MITTIRWIGCLTITLLMLIALPYMYKTLKDALRTARILTGKENVK